jgi:hypothetical protein
MSTFLELKNKITTIFGANDQTFEDELERAINTSIAEINTETPESPHLQSTATFTTTVGASNVTSGIPSDFDHQLSLYLTVNGQNQPPLVYLSKKEWDEKRITEQGNSEPRFYTIWNNTLYLAPKPDQIYTGTIDYYSFDTELTNDTDTCKLSARYPRWEYVIVQGAITKMHEFLQSDDKAMVRTFNQFQYSLGRFRSWVRKNFDKSTESSRVKCWKESMNISNPLVPRPFRRY